MPQLPRRPRGRHLDGHAPLAQARPGGGSGPGPTSSVVAGPPSTGSRSWMPSGRSAGSRCDDAERGAVLQAQVGTGESGRRRRRAAPTQTGRAVGGRPSAARMASMRVRRARGASDPRRRTSRRRCPRRRSSLPSGPLPAPLSTNSSSAAASTASQVRLKIHAVATTGTGRSGLGATTTPSPASASRRAPRRCRGPGRAGEHVAALEDPDLHGPGDRLVHHALDGGAGWWGPEVGGSEVYSTSSSVAEDVHQVGGVERLPGDRPAGAVAPTRRRTRRATTAATAVTPAASRAERRAGRLAIAHRRRSGREPSARTLPPMSRSLVERRLTEVGARLEAAAGGAAVADEQLGHLAGRPTTPGCGRSVSETPVADREHHDAQRHADAMQRHRAEVLGRSPARADPGRAPRPADGRDPTPSPGRTQVTDVHHPRRHRRRRGHHPPRPEGDPPGGGLRGRGGDRPR